MSDTGLCSICRSHLDSDPARCERCDTPYHYACWSRNERQCPVYGCEKTLIEDAEADLRDDSPVSPAWSVRLLTSLIAGFFLLFFFFMTLKTCNSPD